VSTNVALPQMRFLRQHIHPMGLDRNRDRDLSEFDSDPDFDFNFDPKNPKVATLRSVMVNNFLSCPAKACLPVPLRGE